MCVPSCVRLCDFIDCSLPGSSAHGIFWQECQSGIPCPPPGDLPDQGIKLVSLMSPVLAGRFFTSCIHFSKESGCGYLSSFCVCVCMFCLKKCSPFFTLGGSPAHRIYILGLLWLKQEWPLPQPPPPRHSRGPLERGVKSPVEAKVLEF